MKRTILSLVYLYLLKTLTINLLKHLNYVYNLRQKLQKLRYDNIS